MTDLPSTGNMLCVGYFSPSRPLQHPAFFALSPSSTPAPFPHFLLSCGILKSFQKMRFEKDVVVSCFGTLCCLCSDPVYVCTHRFTLSHDCLQWLCSFHTLLTAGSTPNPSICSLFFSPCFVSHGRTCFLQRARVSQVYA